MCGISGIFTVNQVDDKLINISKSIINKISHRGPDNTGIYHNAEDKIILCHKRLSILDLSSNANQPFVSNSKRYIIIFNGEIYNHLELRKNFFSKNFPWITHSDTETLVEFIEKYGFDKFFNEVDGMFAFAIWDRKLKQIHLSRDLFGEKPLYFGFINGNFIFSSELKSFEVFLGQLELNEQSIKEFLELSYISSPNTIYKNIYKLEKSCYLPFSYNDLLKLEKKTTDFSDLSNFYNKKKIIYYDAKSSLNIINNYKNLDVYDYQTLVHEELKKSVKSRMLSDVDVGVFLSGGTDSSLVASIMSEISDKKIKTFTVSSSNQNFDESIKAKKVSKILNSDHNEIKIESRNQLDLIEKLPEIFDEPFGDSSQLPMLFLSEYASKKVKVVLTGDGADEVFKGYNRYLYSLSLWNKINKIPKNLRKLSYNLINYLKPDFILNFQKLLNLFLSKNKKVELLDEKVYKIADTVLNSASLLDHYFSHLAVWQKNENIFNLKNSEHTSEKIFNTFSLNENNYNSYINILDLHSYLPDDILTKTDRSTMNFSLEGRTPYLSKKLLELALNCPRGGLIEKKVGKVVLRNILDTYLPREITSGAKKGFSVPVNSWLNGELKNWADDLFNSEIFKSSKNINSNLVYKYWNDHKNGKKNYHKRLWNVLLLIDWTKKKNKKLS